MSLYQQDQLKKDALQYDQEIDKLSEGMTTIHQLFKQMNDVVMHQGEVVDRIDYNIDVAMKHVSRGKDHLVKAKEYQEHGCARWCIRMQIIGITILAVLIFLKYGK
jgi:syntaxin 16